VKRDTDREEDSRPFRESMDKLAEKRPVAVLRPYAIGARRDDLVCAAFVISAPEGLLAQDTDDIRGHDNI